MKRFTLILAVALLFTCTISYAQTNMTSLCHYIQKKSAIATGGTEIYEYNGTTYIISVAPVVVNDKSEGQCKTVGNSKAKREMLSYINGADITSSTILTNSETVSTTLDGTRVECKQEYIESIKEDVIGTISQASPLGGWYSLDRSVYYFAIYKVI